MKNKIVIYRKNGYNINRYIKSVHPKYKYVKAIQNGSKNFQGRYLLKKK